MVTEDIIESYLYNIYGLNFHKSILDICVSYFVDCHNCYKLLSMPQSLRSFPNVKNLIQLLSYILIISSLLKTESALNLFQALDQFILWVLFYLNTLYNAFFEYQSGFRSRYSVNTCLAHLSNQVLKGFETDKSTRMILIDLQKHLIL